MNQRHERRGDGPWFVIFLVLLALGAKPAADAATSPNHQGRGAPPLVLPGSAARLAPEQIYAYSRRAGFSPDEAVTATAIALAESAGRPRAHNPTPPDDSYCLMQINMLGPLGPARRARFHLRANTDLYDPATCMRVAYGVSAGGSNWQPWTTYTRGTYRQHLSRSYQTKGRR